MGLIKKYDYKDTDLRGKGVKIYKGDSIELEIVEENKFQITVYKGNKGGRVTLSEGGFIQFISYAKSFLSDNDHDSFYL